MRIRCFKNSMPSNGRCTRYRQALEASYTRCTSPASALSEALGGPLGVVPAGAGEDRRRLRYTSFKRIPSERDEKCATAPTMSV